MTHEELLATIDWIGKTKDGESGTATALGVAALASLNALRAVVEKHKPYKPDLPSLEYGTEACLHCNVVYPCETIRDIEEQMR